MLPPTWLTPKEAMQHLKISKATFYRMVGDGRITGYVLAGTTDKRYKQEELDALLTPAAPGVEEGTGDAD